VANFNVTASEITIIQNGNILFNVFPSTSAASPLEVAPGDTITFETLNNSESSVVFSGFSSSAFTSTSSLNLSPGTSQSKTIKSVSVDTTDTLTFASDNMVASFYVKVIAPPSDTVPDAFDLGLSVPDAVLNQYYYRSFDVSGINTASVIQNTDDGEYKINSGSYTVLTGAVVNGDTVTVRLRVISGFSTTKTAGVNVGGVSSSFSITTASEDDSPTAFSIGADVGSSDPGEQITSSPITVGGLNTSVAISVVKGTYSKNGGSYVSTPGTVVNDDTIVHRCVASTASLGSFTTSLTIGSVSDSKVVTTRTIDTVPSSFSIGNDVPSAALNDDYTSSAVIVSGIDAGYPIQVKVTNGTYSKNGTGHTSVTGTVVLNDSIVFRMTSSNLFSTDVTGSLNIGGVAGHTASRTITTLAADTYPSSFSIGNDVPSADINDDYTSTAFNVAGINTSTTISATNGTYSKNGGSPLTSGTVVLDDSIVFSMTSSGSYSDPKTGTLNIGGRTASRTITTEAAPDIIADDFSFGTDQTNAELDTRYERSVTVAGLGAGVSVTASVSGTGAAFSVDSGTLSTSNKSVTNGSLVTFSILSANAYSTIRNGSLSYGSQSDSWGVKTKVAPDTIATDFDFGTNQSNAALNNYYTRSVTVAGLGAGVSVNASVSQSGDFKVNSGSYSTVVKSVTNGDTVTSRIYSGGAFNTQTQTTISYGGQSDGWAVTTLAADTYPSSFSIGTAVPNASLNTNYTSASFNVAGINTSTSISATNGTYSKNGGNHITSGTVVLNDSIVFRMTSSSSYSDPKTGTLNIGGRTASRTITTGVAPPTYTNFPFVSPTSFSLNDVVDFFGGGNSLDDYYRGGANVPDVTQNNGIPTAATGGLSLNDFYGSVK